MAVQEQYLHRAFGRARGIVLVVNSFLPMEEAPHVNSVTCKWKQPAEMEYLVKIPCL